MSSSDYATLSKQTRAMLSIGTRFRNGAICHVSTHTECICQTAYYPISRPRSRPSRKSSSASPPKIELCRSSVRQSRLVQCRPARRKAKIPHLCSSFYRNRMLCQHLKNTTVGPLRRMPQNARTGGTACTELGHQCFYY